MNVADHAVQDSASVSIRRRLLFGLICGGMNAGVGYLRPITWYLVWHLSHFGGVQDWSGLAAIILAFISAIGGGAIGLLIGSVWPGRRSIWIALLALGGLNLMSGGYFIMTSNEPGLFLAIAIPTLVSDVVLACFLSWLWSTSER